MPFKPISTRKPYDVVLDDDKVRFAAEQQRRDEASVAHHYGFSASSTGYRFGNHPMTKGFVRGPGMPFLKAPSPWPPSSLDEDGPHSKFEKKQASSGAIWEGSHLPLAVCLRKSNSTPALKEAGDDASLQCHPLNMELKRWERLAKDTERGEVNKDVQESMQQTRTSNVQVPRTAKKTKNGLVNFPKYMLWNNCYFKSVEQARFAKEQEDAACDENRTEASYPDAGEGPVPYGEPSWGAPLLRHAVPGTAWAGSGMPTGRGCRHSNFYVY
eukprot:TRINITY_DN23794_c0_g1_i1.p1 TRINITY_DN23794_c0_g1~~TRINITY_DN23794_c0_g1_i1.p1  ORF type:complete len:270 (-),score=55.57 TRINITY_DN23794_c0_g1_i1:86-895(-)